MPNRDGQCSGWYALPKSQSFQANTTPTFLPTASRSSAWCHWCMNGDTSRYLNTPVNRNRTFVWMK